MFAQQNTSAHAPSIALLEEGRTSPARPTETTPCLTTEMTVADPGALAGHPQHKAPGQHATVGLNTRTENRTSFILVKLNRKQ